MHLICIFIQFTIAGSVSKKNPLTLIKNQVPGYTTALGTQSSAATIPVNLQCAEADDVCNCRLSDEPASDQSRNCHSVHHDTRHRNGRFPGAPGGSIMTALPFLYMVFGAEAGDPEGAICAIMVALYITQDSFGTACNISGDNAIGIIVDTIYKKFILKTPQPQEN